MPGDQACSDADPFDVPQPTRFGVRRGIDQLGGAHANDATAAVVALVRLTEHLVPSRTPTACTHRLGSCASATADYVELASQRDGLRNPASEVKDVGPGVRALHVVGAAHNLNEGLLQQRHPHFLRDCGVSTEQLAVSPHRDLIVHHDLPRGAIQEETAAVLPAFIVDGTFVARSVVSAARGSGMDDAAEHRILEASLIFSQGRQRG
mmetsp:Transcript_7825/g.19874  ORF Transcript_7825/g.19874 Transcript_7825/m.19874 type:complete len:207 (+) Transcript_7825:742-1362(+)